MFEMFCIQEWYKIQVFPSMLDIRKRVKLINKQTKQFPLKNIFENVRKCIVLHLNFTGCPVFHFIYSFVLVCMNGAKNSGVVGVDCISTYRKTLLTSILFFVHSTVSELFLNKIQPQVGSAQLELVHYLFHWTGVMCRLSAFDFRVNFNYVTRVCCW